jgi:hypothetical protein
LTGFSDLLGDLSRGCLLGIADHHTCDCCGERDGDRSTDAAAGYFRNLAFQEKVRQRQKHHSLRDWE